MASLFSFVIAFLFLSCFALAASADGAAGIIGVNYGRVANNLPTPTKVVELLKTQGINRVKIYNTDSQVLTALADSGITVSVALPNELLSSAAADQNFADNWVKANISQYYPQTMIDAIAVGNEVFNDPKITTPYLVPAMKNVHTSLVKFNLSSIKISSPIALSALQNSYPSSAGSFKPELITSVIKPMLDFLSQTGSYLMLNAYPFFAYAANSDVISLDYALFNDNPGVADSGNGLKYYSLLEAQLDAVYAAMSAVQHDDVKMVVTETGWPSAGDEDEIGTSEGNAASYNRNLVKRVLTGNGTPLRPQDPLNVYLFALFKENEKPGPTSERNYGLFYPSEEKVYNVPFTAEQLGGKGHDEETPVNKSKNPVGSTEVSKTTTSVQGQTWCVANGNAGAEKLQAGLDYACGKGEADCRPIQEGASCYNPNTIQAHASYAFNSYYQKKARGAGTCDFGGAAYVVTQQPRNGKCEFPSGY